MENMIKEKTVKKYWKGDKGLIYVGHCSHGEFGFYS